MIAYDIPVRGDLVDYPYRLPGTSSPEITIRPALFGIRVLVDGVPVQSRGFFRKIYPIPLPDGTVRELSVVSGPGGLRASADGVTTAIGPQSSVLEFVLAFLPIGLVTIGGLIGGLIGGAAVGVNLGIARSGARRPIRILEIVAVTILAVVVWIAAAFAFRAAIAPQPPSHPFALASGTCLNGLRPGVTITTDMLRSVDCAGPHDNEVVGGSGLAFGDVFPGQARLQTFAANICLPAFRSYVGIDIQASSLDVLPLLPTEDRWSRGERDLSCVVMTRDGAQLTGSVLGTRR
ncbi:MAG TPA: septum formation family protein [Candidatus Limnocylindrales bacterium]|nr:septum formation family protein [Candidatus Limnocylindrales bacterium]